MLDCCHSLSLVNRFQVHAKKVQFVKYAGFFSIYTRGDPLFQTVKPALLFIELFAIP